MIIKRLFQILLIASLSLFFVQPSQAAWPILNEKDLNKFINTFPSMYREYKQLTITVNPNAGSKEKKIHDQEVNRILTENGWNFTFWLQLPTIYRGYALHKHENFNNAHGSNIEKFMNDLKNSNWLAPEHKSGLNAFFSQTKANANAEAAKTRKEVHKNDLNLTKKYMSQLDSVMEQIMQIEIEAAQGKLGKTNFSGNSSDVPSSALAGTTALATDSGSSSIIGRWKRKGDNYIIDVKEINPGQYEGITVNVGSLGGLAGYTKNETVFKLSNHQNGIYKGTIKKKFFGSENWEPTEQVVQGNNMTGEGDWERLIPDASVSETPQDELVRPPVLTTPPPQNIVGQQTNPMVHQRGQFIVDGSGQPIQLRGTLIEGWLMMNGTLWGAGLHSETTVYKKIEELVGPEETERFRQTIYDNFFTENDVKLMAEMGFNVMRIPFNHTILEDDDRPYIYKESGWRLLDRVIEWGERHGVYVVLDLHSTLGGQSSIFVADPDKELLWDSKEKKLRTIALWKAIASRYRDKQIVAGYDLINEPAPKKKDDLVDMYKRITAAIREVDPHHMVILEGAGLADDFSMFEKLPAQPVPNMVYNFHTYNFFSSSLPNKQVREMKKLSDKHMTPIWNSEFGANTTQWVKGTVDLYETNGFIGWVYWPWKRVDEQNKKRWAGLFEIPNSPNWNKTRKWIGALFGLFAPKPTREEALKGMCEFIQMTQVHNLSQNSEMALALGMTPGRTGKPADTVDQVQAMCSNSAQQNIPDPIASTIPASPTPQPTVLPTNESAPPSFEPTTMIDEKFKQDIKYKPGKYFLRYNVHFPKTSDNEKFTLGQKSTHVLKCLKSYTSISCNAMDENQNDHRIHRGVFFSITPYKTNQTVYWFNYRYNSHNSKQKKFGLADNEGINFGYGKTKKLNGEIVSTSAKTTDRTYERGKNVPWQDLSLWNNDQASECTISVRMDKLEGSMRGKFHCSKLWTHHSIDKPPMAEKGPAEIEGEYYMPCDTCKN